MNNKLPTKKAIFLCLLTGCLLGILCFILVYGVKILDFTYDDWILCGDVDIKQHYLGFCHLRKNSIRTFPVGIISTLSKPFDMSVIYTDSIPLFAVIFRLFSKFLPQHFQYFGLFGIICFALMGGLSAVLIRRFTDRYLIVFGGSLFFILSYPVLQRMFYHTALAAQWIIILALVLWVYKDITKFSTWVCWFLLGFLCVSIHSYYVFFTGLILLTQVVEYYVNQRLKNFTIKPIIPVVLFCLSSFFTLYAFGAFYGAGEVTKGGFGDFNGNLNGFINPGSYSLFFNPMPYNGMFEYEGFGYLGAGILLILIVAIAYLLVSVFIRNNFGRTERTDSTISEAAPADNTTDITTDNIKTAPKEYSTRLKVFFWLAVVSFILATMPRFSFNNMLILNIPLPASVKEILGICRTNGRFIWTGTYLIILLSLLFINKNYDRVWIKCLFVLAIILQLCEMSGKAMEIHRAYNAQYTYTPVFSEPEAEKLLEGKKQFVFMYDPGDIRMDTAYTAYLKRMTQNSFYYARPIDDLIVANIKKIRADFLNGEINKRSVYIFRDEDYTSEFKNAVIVHGAVEYMFDGHVAVALMD